ncbi:MAG TPA: 4-phosphoerythronate dehydrogenase PdxB [Candidatus Hydrogenedentes bacterium]|nr:4-phosphoerythronate dehydrogenase PdxB [Candidatus Hydrogenedentota bacterium]HOS02070.1 4-phosphoerythronate dehydrogenase PdxB [Candidatus Hydrogenedentota bacterium]
MKIVADENIPYAREAFSTLGEVAALPGRTLSPEAVRDADLLMVRSITKVNAALLEGSSVRFVATATIGEDHIDKSYLAERGIGFSSAPGCNAESVAQYIAAALLELAGRYTLQLGAMSLGVIGVGNVGSRVARAARALGMRCVLNDPPRARAEGGAEFGTLEDAAACDVVTFHVPLTKNGPDATYHLADAAFFQSLRPGAILLNTSRGAVVDNAALNVALASGRMRAAALDVWEGEPLVDVELLKQVFIGTPHIAGYSFDGKVNGTVQIYRAACAFLGVAPTWDPAPLLPAPECPEVTVRGDTSNPQAELREAVRKVYDIRRDDAAMRTLLDAPQEERGPRFDRLRKEYPRRREFQHTRAIVQPESRLLAGLLMKLGFAV